MEDWLKCQITLLIKYHQNQNQKVYVLSCAVKCIEFNIGIGDTISFITIVFVHQCSIYLTLL